MNIRQLEAFYWIMRLGSFVAAAEKLGATQPAISARIKELEQSIGAPLFLRGGKSLQPNASARTLFPLASDALGILAEIRGKLGSPKSIGGVVRIGMGEIVALSWFPRFLAHLNAAYPSVQLEIFMDVTTNLLETLNEGRLDLAVVVAPGPPHLHYEKLGATPLRWMASSALVNSSDDLTPEAVGQLPIYTLSRNSHLHARTLKWFQDRGVRPRVVHSCNNLGVIIKLVQLGCGAALIPPILVADELRTRSLMCIAPATEAESTTFYLARHDDIIDPTILRISEMVSEFAHLNAK